MYVLLIGHKRRIADLYVYYLLYLLRCVLLPVSAEAFFTRPTAEKAVGRARLDGPQKKDQPNTDQPFPITMTKFIY